MQIAEILKPESAIVNIKAKGRKEVIDRLLDVARRVWGLDKKLAVRDIAVHERSYLIRMQAGKYFVAIPHSISQACKQPLLAVATSREGVLWGDAPGEHAHLIFLLLAPPQTHDLYVRVLIRLANMCEHEEFVHSLLSAESPQEIVSVLEMMEALLGEVVEETSSPRFCVLGAGAGGMAMAGHLALMGRKVNLFTRNFDRLAPVVARGGIDVTGEVQGLAKLNIVTTEAAQAVGDCDVLMVVVPATAHRNVAQIIAPHICDGQIIVLNPGRTGGALEFAQVLKTINPDVHPYIAEAQTLIYASRLTNPGQVHIFGNQKFVPLAAFALLSDSRHSACDQNRAAAVCAGG